METSIIITTYNRPDALELVILSALNQTISPCQIIIADDGSDDRTKLVIDRYAAISKIPIVHVWQEDIGFRVARIRNKALAKVESPYVILIDGDILMTPRFIEDHLKFAKPGHFIQGGRILLNQALTSGLLTDSSRLKYPSMLHPGFEQYRFEKRVSAFRNLLFAKLTLKDLASNRSKVRSCNMSFYMADVRAVNGFNNRFEGWGREDSEFVERLFNNGLKGLLVRFAAIGYHLYHREESRQALPQNDFSLKRTKSEKLKFCEDGLSRFL
ncbi:glycosyltransferase family 2 protein [Sphingobacterium sp. InxBP1]|nr:glycosyltransferase family 2 protein [Sphingobacterium sp. InxBP1]